MIPPNFYRIFLILNIFCSYLGFAPSQQAKIIQPVLNNNEVRLNCTAVDLAFVIDQSQEISNIDADQVRINAIYWLIDVLGYDRLMQCPDTVHRVTVISFGGTGDPNSTFRTSETSVVLDITPIDPVPTTANPWNDWATEHKSIVDSIKLQKFNERNFQSVYDALNIATHKLNDAPDIGTVDRKKAIILMIGGNGAPCTSSLKCAHHDIPEYKEQLDDLFEEEIEEKISFWTLLYGTEVEPTSPYKFAEFWETVSGPFGGKVFDLVDVDLDTAKTFMSIYQTLSPHPDLKEVCGSTSIDPIVEKVAFSIFSKGKQAKITFMSQMNSKISSTGQAEVNKLLYFTNTAGGPLTILDYVFKYPIPGEWQFDASCSDKQALVYVQVNRTKEMEFLGPNEKLAQYKEPGKLFDATDMHYMQMQVVDSQKKPVPSLIAFAAVSKGEVDVPGQEPYPLTFHYKDGVYTSNEALPVNVAGEIPWKADFTFQPADMRSGNEPQVIHLEGKYTVAVRKPFIIELEKPDAGQRFTVHGGALSDYWMKTKPVDVQVRIAPRDAGDNAENISLPLTGDLNAAIKVTLINTYTNQSQDIWLEQSKEDPFLFKGQVGSMLNEEGEYVVVASFNGTYDLDNYRFVQTEASTKVQRFDTWATEPGNYKAAAGIISAIIMALLLLLFYRISNPVSGYLLFSAPIPDQPPFVTINLSEIGRRKVTLTQSSLKEKSRLLDNLEKIEVKKDRLFGGKHVVSVRESGIQTVITEELDPSWVADGQTAGDTQELDQSLATEDQTVGYTNKGYKIKYSATPPVGAPKGGR